MKPLPLATYLWVWIGLLALLALSCGSSFLALHGFNGVTNLGIACAKVALIGVFFMRLNASDPLVRLIALVSILWAMILFGLSLTDFLAAH